jgi:hypothetical protein
MVCRANRVSVTSRCVVRPAMVTMATANSSSSVAGPPVNQDCTCSCSTSAGCAAVIDDGGRCLENVVARNNSISVGMIDVEVGCLVAVIRRRRQTPRLGARSASTAGARLCPAGSGPGKVASPAHGPGLVFDDGFTPTRASSSARRFRGACSRGR